MAEYTPLPFEALKVSLRQNKDGVVVSFVIHPSDVHPDILTDPVGTRYQLVAVKLGDDGRPVEGAKPPAEPRPPARGGLDINPVEKARQNVVASAGILCRDKRFHEWVSQKYWEGAPVTEVQAIEWLLDSCGVKTRVALKTSDSAREKFFAIRKEFEEWKQRVPPF